MAAVTHAGTTFNTTAGDKTVTATPVLNDLIIVVAATSGLSGGTISVTDDNAGGHGTYVQVDADRTGFSTTGVLTVWVRADTIQSATSTIFTATQTSSSGGGLTVYQIAGMSIAGPAAIRSNGGQSSGGSGTTPAPVLDKTPLTTNVIITSVANGTNVAGMTQPATYTQAPTPDVGYNAPATGLSCAFKNSGITNATITWGSTSASAFASVAIELDISVPLIYPDTAPERGAGMLPPDSQAVNRSSVW